MQIKRIDYNTIKSFRGIGRNGEKKLERSRIFMLVLYHRKLGLRMTQKLSLRAEGKKIVD